jgi:single-strand DNA-binding protein
MPATITIVGNLGRDPETRYTPNGRMNVALNVAVSHRFRDASGQQQERTNWFRVTAWGTLAESLDRLAQQGWLVKGRQVFVSGRFEARDYTSNDGQQRTSLDINANEVSLVGGRPDGESSSGGSSGGSFGSGGSGGSVSGGSRGQQSGSAPNFDDLPDSGGDIDDIPF